MERLNYYIRIKDNILVNDISSTLWFHPAKKYPRKPIIPEVWWTESVADKVVTLGGKEKSYLIDSLLGAKVEEKTPPPRTKENQATVNLLPMVVLALSMYPVYSIRVNMSQWWCTVMCQSLGRWSPRSDADKLFSPNHTDNAQTSWPLSWKQHFSSINEDLLLYWSMMHFSSAGPKSMSATWSLRTEGRGLMSVIPTLLNTPELTHK